MNQKTILLVEDDVLLAEAEARLLSRHGYAVLTVSSGEQALDMVAEMPTIDLVLMDISLEPGQMDGIQAAQAIQQVSALPIVFLSAHDDPEIIERTEQVTSYGYVVKNSGSTALLTSLKMALHLFAANQRLQQDILARQQAEAALRESEANFHAFFETLTDLVVVARLDGRILYTNTALSRVLGYSAAELASLHVLDLNPRDKRQEAEAIFAAMFRGERDTCPLPVVRKDGVLLPAETRVWLGRWNGQDCVYGLVKDLTDEQESQQRFERLFRNNPALMALTTVPGRRFFDVNNAFLETTGYTRAEVMGKTVADLRLAVQPDRLDAATERVLAGERIENLEVQVRCKDGTIRDGLFWGEMISSQGCEYFLSLMIDISERKRMARELEAQRDFATQIINLMGQGLVVTGPDSRLEFVNPAYARMGGWALEDLVGRHTTEFVTPDSQVVLADNLQRRQAGQSGTYEVSLRRADGGVTPVLVTAVPRNAADAPAGASYGGAIAVVSDLTERKQAEQEILTLLSEKEALLQELQHRAKNSFFVISSLVSLMEDASRSREARTVLADLHHRVNALAELYDLLYQTNAVTDTWLDTYCARVAQALPLPPNLRLVEAYDPVIIPVKIAAPVGMILTELLTNAIKYAFPGGRPGKITVTLHPAPGEVRLAVADDGVGLPAGFDLARHASLGFNLVQTLTRQIEGSFSIESGDGTRCEVVFPA